MCIESARSQPVCIEPGLVAFPPAASRSVQGCLNKTKLNNLLIWIALRRLEHSVKLWFMVHRTREALVPRWVVHATPGWRRPAHVAVPGWARCSMNQLLDSLKTYPGKTVQWPSCIHIHCHQGISDEICTRFPETNIFGFLFFIALTLTRVKKDRQTCKVLSSKSANGSGGSLLRAAGAASIGARSQGADHWARWSRNRSFQAARSRTSWSAADSAWKGARQRTQRTAMNSRRALVSCKNII